MRTTYHHNSPYWTAYSNNVNFYDMCNGIIDTSWYRWRCTDLLKLTIKDTGHNPRQCRRLTRFFHKHIEKRP